MSRITQGSAGRTDGVYAVSADAFDLFIFRIRIIVGADILDGRADIIVKNVCGIVVNAVPVRIRHAIALHVRKNDRSVAGPSAVEAAVGYFTDRTSVKWTITDVRPDDPGLSNIQVFHIIGDHVKHIPVSDPAFQPVFILTA